MVGLDHSLDCFPACFIFRTSHDPALTAEDERLENLDKTTQKWYQRVFPRQALGLENFSVVINIWDSLVFLKCLVEIANGRERSQKSVADSRTFRLVLSYLYIGKCRLLGYGFIVRNPCQARECILIRLQGLAYEFTIRHSQSLFVQRCSTPKMATMSQIYQLVTKSMTWQRWLFSWISSRYKVGLASRIRYIV